MGKPGDQGADLIIWRGGEKTACQLKRQAKDVSNKAVQEAVTAREYYGCHHAMVVTNRSFTKGAKDAADRTRCQLIERQQLGAMIESFRGGKAFSEMHRLVASKQVQPDESWPSRTAFSGSRGTRYTIRVTKN